MVCVYGMNPKIGLAHTARRQNGFLGAMDGAFQRDCSEETAREIDQEVKRLLDRCYAEAKDILSAHRDQLELVALELLKRETLDRQAFYRLLGRDEPHDKSVPAVVPPEPAHGHPVRL
jgi:cell division protease FtsH